ncbi:MULTISPECIES: amidohydrolase family protein [Candidatus Microthrix]|jgi:predicted TIM-barrel fold metal-dependent hydrolase|uniref:Amidohydrolase-related domain-containing protein n=1 Tax=Candidatus Neomicrothrix parvicella RN1 TaxID=1229780 RepID=R4Z761_9ACTN|nr:MULTISPECIES: amidohydrolase family protein [Microthrix]NLH65780.1 amidohydrolase [Candidatus Microthrix parvicella]MBK6502003.1 amidohydrolase [Candidatus Microthrix sp.]MBK7018449.1 amidohydrolase [Candidatus Microthrix sp.]MBK7322081.1 amidohydrolase [Candidatus Microthrix sp.]MBL0205962.1 amidohydrolase [Candidatus Microthrix sp.]
MDLPKIISIDDHVIEPADVWQSRLPAKYRDVGPRVIQERGKMQFVGGVFSYEPSDEGELCDWWLYEDKRVPQTRLSAAAGFSREEVKVTGITYEEMRDGCYDPVARLADMDMNHTEAQMSFPSFPRFCGQTFMEAEDKELSDLCVKAYNDWMVEEWCAGSDGRLIPLTIVQLWDAELAAAEIHRNAERGVRAVCFSEIPPYLNLPSIHTDYWEPFFRACEETGTVINMHIGSSSKMPSTSTDAPAAVGSTLTFGNAMSSMADWLFSGWLDRLPTLKLAYSEGQIGWIPYILERADNVWEENRAWGGFGDKVPEPPSTYYYRQIYGCFFDDVYGLDNLEKVGVNNICFETDYPHSDSTWPHSKETAEKLMGHLPEDVIYKLMRGNAIEMLGLDFDK